MLVWDCYIKKCLLIFALFHDVPAGAIETLVNEQNQPLLKRTNLGRYLGPVDIRQHFKILNSAFLPGQISK